MPEPNYDESEKNTSQKKRGFDMGWKTVDYEEIRKIKHEGGFTKNIWLEPDVDEAIYAYCEHDKIIAAIKVSDDPDVRGCLYIDEFEVCNSRRCEGVGKKVIGIIQEKENRTIRLSSVASAFTFWEKCGFIFEGGGRLNGTMRYENRNGEGELGSYGVKDLHW